MWIAEGMPYNKILVITDNFLIFTKFIESIGKLKIDLAHFSFACSHQSDPNFTNSVFVEQINSAISVQKIDVKQDLQHIIARFDLVISLHCKQIFPKELLDAVPCINIHPGYNPYNRGWLPHVFSMINKLPCGATIHEIDVAIDHGAIIDQIEVSIQPEDTSLTVYNKILQAEIYLLEKNLRSIIAHTYETKKPGEGNVNLKKDFRNLCQLDIDEIASLQYFIDKLRALSHGAYNNAFFIDQKTGKKIFVKITLEVDEE